MINEISKMTKNKQLASIGGRIANIINHRTPPPPLPSKIN